MLLVLPHSLITDSQSGINPSNYLLVSQITVTLHIIGHVPKYPL